MKKQYLIQKFVMAESVDDAIKRSKKLPIHEVYVHNAWFEKQANYDFFSNAAGSAGFKPIDTE